MSDMRVIAGTHRGRRLNGPQEFALRPTSDRVREALFSILGDRVANSRFLDLFAGTGAVGIEAVSRGARHVTSVESDRAAVKLLFQNMQLCNLSHEIVVHAQSVERFLSCSNQWHGPYEIVFADPPYTRVPDFLSMLTKSITDNLFTPDAWLILEHATKTTLPVSIGDMTFHRRYRYGDTSLSVFSHAASRPS